MREDVIAKARCTKKSGRGFLSVTVFVTNDGRLLVYGRAVALSEPLAGLLTVGRAFCE
jgi:hypothetical protein